MDAGRSPFARSLTGGSRPAPIRRSPRSADPSGDPAQDGWQDAALAVVADVNRPVEPGDGLEAPLAAAVGRVGPGNDRQPLPRREVIGETVDRV